MSRIVAVSNRLPDLRPSGNVNEPEVPVGGLASAVLSALRHHPESIWFGWSGRVEDARPEGTSSQRSSGRVTMLGMSFSQAELDEYYLGFCNETLWPLLHSFQGRVKIRLRHAQRYEEVQTRFAAALRPRLRPDDLVWVHDYHLLLLARELRRAGWNGRIGFFLHTPFPAHDIFQILPEPRDFLAAMLQYDVVGFHVRSFLDNYVYCCSREVDASWDGETLGAHGRMQRVSTYPVGIEPEDFLPPAGDAREPKRHRVLGRLLSDRKLVLGVDRLDYTKGIPERVLAFETFLRRHPAWRRKVVFLQIAAPSRTGVPDYVEQRSRLEALLGRVNGELGEHDWTPIRYLYRSYPRTFLAKVYRDADVALVTPLRDGMNLVAKEFVAAQRPDRPGVLILSRTAGAAQELQEALVVNAFIPSHVASAIETALSMSLEERRARHAALLARVLSAPAREWSRRFLADLACALPAAPAHERGAQMGEGGVADG